MNESNTQRKASPSHELGNDTTKEIDSIKVSMACDESSDEDIEKGTSKRKKSKKTKKRKNRINPGTYLCVLIILMCILFTPSLATTEK